MLVSASQWQSKLAVPSKAKTKQLLSGCSRVLRTPTSEVCSAGGHESVCQRPVLIKFVGKTT